MQPGQQRHVIDFLLSQLIQGEKGGGGGVKSLQQPAANPQATTLEGMLLQRLLDSLRQPEDLTTSTAAGGGGGGASSSSSSSNTESAMDVTQTVIKKEPVDDDVMDVTDLYKMDQHIKEEVREEVAAEQGEISNSANDRLKINPAVDSSMSGTSFQPHQQQSHMMDTATGDLRVQKKSIEEDSKQPSERIMQIQATIQRCSEVDLKCNGYKRDHIKMMEDERSGKRQVNIILQLHRCLSCCNQCCIIVDV